MATYINLEELITLVTSTYGRSTLTGNEWAKIFRIRYGQQDKKPNVNARDSKGSGFLQDGLPED